MRRFVQEVFRNTLIGTTEQYSPPSTFDALGSVEKLALHVRAKRASSATPTLTVTLYHSNDGQDWIVRGSAFTGMTLSTSLEKTYMQTDTNTSGAFVRVGVVMSGAQSTDTVDVAIVACGRAELAG